MAIDYQKLKNRKFADVVQTYTARDTMLYALGIGMGMDPLDRNELPYVYEENLRMVPTMPVVLGTPGFWVKEPDSGVTWQSVLHGEQGLTIDRPLPATGTVIGRTTVESIQSGAVFGFAGQVDGICRRLADELGAPTVVATGGLAELIAPYTTSIKQVEPWLTLHGLRVVFERNQ